MFGLSRDHKPDMPRGARGYRAYAVGDIHGRLDLLELMLSRIEADLAACPAGKTVLVFLGDLIDRGPCSAQVVERLRTFSCAGVKTVFLLGNHEEVLLRILDGDASLIDKWRWVGGAQCLSSYGVDPETLASMDDAAAVAAVRAAIPKAHLAFLQSFADTFRFGDYLFVHAGIRPGIPVEQQRQSDLRWIREPFLGDDTDHGFVVVHGHTISRDVDEQVNRIGIDTGAYAHGVLTALAIDGPRRWYLTADQAALAEAVASPH